MKKTPDTFSGYHDFISALKQRVIQARASAGRAVNRELIALYWDIGAGIVEKQKSAGWGDAVVERIAADLRASFPDIKGFSSRNVWDMRRLFEAYSSEEFLRQLVTEIHVRGLQSEDALTPKPHATRKQGINKPERSEKHTAEVRMQILRQLVAETPWGHHLLILNKCSDVTERLYYLRATARYGWSRDVLRNQIKADAFGRAVLEKKTHNFSTALPEHYAEQADEMLKSRYNLEFLGIRQAILERDLETRLVAQLERFILELGYGFCFIGRQYRLAVGSKEYFVDLLFYHRFLKALVAFDLKIGSFEPEHSGKMDFYLNLLNDKERAPDDQPSIGIILCAGKDDVEVEIALRTKNNPIGVAEYELISKLPPELKGHLPTPRQLSTAMQDFLRGAQ